MARRRGSKSGNSGLGVIILLIFGGTVAVFEAIGQYVSENKESIIISFLIIVISILFGLIVNGVIQKHRKELLSEILTELKLAEINDLVTQCDETVTVKSRRTLDNYNDLKFFKDNDSFETVSKKSESRKQIKNVLNKFLENNNYTDRPQYNYVAGQLNSFLELANGYRVLVVYITSAGNNRGQRLLHITSSRVDELITHPEYLMSKGEYDKILKQQSKKELEAKKHDCYEMVNEIIDYANAAKDTLIVKSQIRTLDELAQKLFDKTVNSIQKVSNTDSNEWTMLENFISTIDTQVHQIVEDDRRIHEYYKSDAFAKIKETCELITKSKEEFNEYISEKASCISNLFGTRIVRNETQNADVYKYIRPYKKSITPFNAEVSSTVFASAENDPIGYIIKNFYASKSQYTVQLQKLRLLIGELETLREAKEIIENYKKEYADYIQDVPHFIMINDEAGFYSRLGLTIVDEAVLDVGYKFAYTSGGGMAQRSFTVPMIEENIIEIIHQLESKLSIDTLAKEQRALMTSKLRSQIMERDNYTCCQCGNSSQAEPNLLLEIDHIIPVSKGGMTQEGNLQTLCWKCNRSKGSKLIL